MYADAGFDDILYGFPFIPSHLERVIVLAERLEVFHLMVTTMEMCHYLDTNPLPGGKPWSVFLKVMVSCSLCSKWHKHCRANKLRYAASTKMNEVQIPRGGEGG